ncbi:hypothetical protein NXY00_16595 [Bacteroides sp. BFG-551]|nr:hypothetical protein [Bacteroides sp. BFG-551]
MKDNERLSDEADDVMIRFADLHFDPDFVIDNNQGQERALGFVRMYNLFPRCSECRSLEGVCR